MEAHLPDLVKEITADIGDNIDHLLDIKLMVIRRIEENPELANRIFLEVGQKEMNFIVNSGFLFGLLLGLPQIPLFAAFDQWWILPIGGVVVGYLTNAIALRVIFEPVNPRQDRPVHGPGPVPATPAGGRRGLLADHRRRHRHPREHRQRADGRAAARIAPSG